MNARKQRFLIATILALIAVGIGVAFWWERSASNDRSLSGRLERYISGEPLLAQRANDLAEDIRSISLFTNLQPWAVETIRGALLGTVQSNGPSPLYWTDTAFELAPEAAPEFIKKYWSETNVGVTKPNLIVVFSPGHQSDYLVISFWEYGAAIGLPSYRLSFYAAATNEVAPGIYTYYLSK